jgi:hypothetical protein
VVITKILHCWLLCTVNGYCTWLCDMQNLSDRVKLCAQIMTSKYLPSPPPLWGARGGAVVCLSFMIKNEGNITL